MLNDSNRAIYITTLFVLLEKFYKNKGLGFAKKFKNKLRTKPGLLSRKR